MRIENNYEYNSIELYFDGKPDENVRNILMSEGFGCASEGFGCASEDFGRKAQSNINSCFKPKFTIVEEFSQKPFTLHFLNLNTCISVG